MFSHGPLNVLKHAERLSVSSLACVLERGQGRRLARCPTHAPSLPFRADDRIPANRPTAYRWTLGAEVFVALRGTWPGQAALRRNLLQNTLLFFNRERNTKELHKND